MGHQNDEVHHRHAGWRTLQRKTPGNRDDRNHVPFSADDAASATWPAGHDGSECHNRLVREPDAGVQKGYLAEDVLWPGQRRINSDAVSGRRICRCSTVRGSLLPGATLTAKEKD